LRDRLSEISHLAALDDELNQEDPSFGQPSRQDRQLSVVSSI